VKERFIIQKTSKMQRCALLLLFSIFGLGTYGQESLPIINATSSTVDISVGDDFFIKGGWYLEPDKNPDVFSLGSKWTYEHKKVSFITDIDSISFDVQPGNKYNFIILLNNAVPCHIQIVTSPNPVFMNSKILIPLGMGFAFMVILFYLKRKQINTIYLLRLGYFQALLFWGIVFISGEIHGDYNHLKNVISELGAIGTRSEVFTSTSLIVLATLCTLFSFGFYKASIELELSIVPAILSFSTPVSLAWAAIFPLGNEFHGMTGPLPLLIILASLLVFLMWKKEKTLFSIRNFSLLSFFIMSLILLRFIKPFGISFEGLIQRFFYLGWTLWIVTISHLLKKSLDIKNSLIKQKTAINN
jgi:hypothetical membrane protein